MRILKITVAVLFIANFAYADITKPPAMALEWWLKSRNKMTGSTVCTREKPDGYYEINDWKVLGIPKPNDKQVMDIIYDYENALPTIDIETEQSERKKTLESVGLTEQDLVKIKALP